MCKVLLRHIIEVRTIQIAMIGADNADTHSRNSDAGPATDNIKMVGKTRLGFRRENVFKTGICLN